MKMILKKISATCFVLLFLATFCFSSQIKSIYANENLEKTFGADGTEYKRVSVFFSRRWEMDKSGITELRNKMIERLRNSPSVKMEEMENVFMDAYEGNESLQISYQQTYAKVNGTFVGGQYFAFHKMSFVQGNHFDEEDMMEDKAVISRSLAFALFGSDDCVGKTIWINEKGIVICGVVKDEKGYNSKLVNTDAKRIYLPYDMAEELGCQPILTAYEILLPEPLEGFAIKTMFDVLSVNSLDREASLKEKEISIIEETDRYQVINLLHTGSRIYKRLIKAAPIAYPDWENERIIAEEQLLLIWFVRILSLLALLITGICETRKLCNILTTFTFCNYQ